VTNFGAGGRVTALIEPSLSAPPLQAEICEADPVSAVCIGTRAGSVELDVPSGGQAVLAVFVTATGDVIFDPATNRIFVRFVDAAGRQRGLTSVAIRAR
jgi:hypothetical protein